ncbi:MAG TPA: calcium-binding protein [Acidimicrobiia bacterium]|jgi:Ca2+-binding RTX toxin-like protein|nr:calcium-binding protein [Acidimicrobiia bacterium]
MAASAFFGAAQALAAATTVGESTGSQASELLINDSGDVANTINVSAAGNTITIVDSAAGVANATPTVCTTINATTITCPLDPPDPAPPAAPASPVGVVTSQLNDGADSFTSSFGPPITEVIGGDGQKTVSTNGTLEDIVVLEPGTGPDNVTTGPGSDIVLPGDGNDTIRTGDNFDFVLASLGADNVDTGAGNDQIDGGGFNDGNDVLNGGAGAGDFVDYGSGEIPVHVSLDGVANDGHGSEADNVVGVENVEGGGGADAILGDANANQLSGSDGNDSISGLGGADEISGDQGNDAVDAGDGNDTVEAGSQADGADAMNGGAGSDEVDYCCGNDPVNINQNGLADDGRAGEGDNLAGFEGFDGSDGADTITGNASANLFFGEGGNDRLVGGGGDDQFFAGPGDDTAVGGAKSDDFGCDLGFDSVIASPGDNVHAGCERRGATPTGDIAKVKTKGKGPKKSFAKVEVSCPASESAPCKGKVSLLENGKVIAKGKMKIAAGKTRAERAKLTKTGRAAFGKAHGSLRASADAATTEPAGTTVNETTLVLQR